MIWERKFELIISRHPSRCQCPTAMKDCLGLGGDPSSIEFCHLTGLDYVSCSPFRVPIARLTGAQAAIVNDKEKAERI